MLGRLRLLRWGARPGVGPPGQPAGWIGRGLGAAGPTARLRHGHQAVAAALRHHDESAAWPGGWTALRPRLADAALAAFRPRSGGRFLSVEPGRAAPARTTLSLAGTRAARDRRGSGDADRAALANPRVVGRGPLRNADDGLPR